MLAGKCLNVPIPKELANIIKEASALPSTGPPLSVAAHLDAIQSRKTQETASYLRAAMLRLQNA